MSGTGKYTTYAPPASEKNTFLNKLFRSEHDTVKPLLQDLVGKEMDARDAIVAIAKVNLAPKHQQGDLSYFPQGVDLDYRSAPNVAEVTWTRPGDPANSFVADTTSPGPDKTEGLQKDEDPKIAVKDLKPKYVPGAPNTGTKSPSVTNAKIIAASILGVSSKMGDSGGNV